MSRIEISIQEFNSLKDKIRTLESSLIDVSKEAAIYKEKYSALRDLSMDLENESLLNRIFNWKDILKPFKKLLLRRR